MPGPWWAFLVPAAVEVIKEIISLLKPKEVTRRAKRKEQEARAPK